jgi:hypothetical protein
MPITKVTKVCVHCFKEFQIYPSHADRIYCNRFCYDLHRVPPLEERFWKSVKKTDGCWFWIAAASQDGYGEISIKGKNVGAHRISWVLHYGEIPDGLWVLHKCDNPPCVRPDHLFLRTQKHNLADAASKARMSSGSRHYKAKLTKEDVRLIRDWYATDTVSQSFIAEKFAVDQTIISDIVRRKSWKHIP